MQHNDILLSYVVKFFGISFIHQGVSFDVKPGDVVALVGPSGGGKTTIVNLIEKFYKPDDGQIRLGKYPLFL